MKPDADLTIVIISFNTQKLLARCLTSLLGQNRVKTRAQIMVVDNASTDGSASLVKHKFPQVELIPLTENVGFAGANNIGIGRSKSKYILLLNSDTEVSASAIEEIYEFMQSRPDVGALTCKLIFPDGRIDPACHRGFPTPWAAFTYLFGLEKLFPHSPLFSQYHLGFKDMNQAHEIDSPSGAFFWVRREVVSDVGLLDEDYFMYGEDLDWAYRIKHKGWKIYYYPFVWVIHHKKQSGRLSTDAVTRQRTRNYFFDTMKLFYQKHYQHRYGWLLTKIIFLGIRLRSLI